MVELFQKVDHLREVLEALDTANRFHGMQPPLVQVSIDMKGHGHIWVDSLGVFFCTKWERRQNSGRDCTGPICPSPARNLANLVLGKLEDFETPNWMYEGVDALMDSMIRKMEHQSLLHITGKRKKGSKRKMESPPLPPTVRGRTRPLHRIVYIQPSIQRHQQLLGDTVPTHHSRDGQSL